MYESENGHIDVVTELLKHGADINAKNNDGKLGYIFIYKHDYDL